MHICSTHCHIAEDPVPRLLLQPASPATATEAAANQDALAAAEAQEQAAEAAGQVAEGAGAAEGTGEAASSPAATSVLQRFPAVTASAALRAAGLAQGPVVGAAGGAAGAGRSARANVLPAFAHIGPQRLLLAHGTVPTAAATATAAGAAAFNPAAGQSAQQQQQQQQQQQWLQVQLLGLHSMAHYRSRVAALCHRTLAQQQQQQQQQGQQQGQVEQSMADHAIQLSRSLAPAVEVQHAEARLPVLSWAQPSSAAAPQQAQQAQQGPRPPVLLTVTVRGAGLELCTRALLRLPGVAGPAYLAASLSNPARERLMADLPAAGGGMSGSNSSSSSSSHSHGWLQAVGSAAKRAATAMTPGHHLHWQPQQSQPTARPDLVARFAVPPAALQQFALQQQQQQQPQPLAAELLLLTDYGRHAAAVQLRPAVVWVAGTDAALCSATLRQLEAAAAEAAAPAAAAEQQRWLRRPSLPSRAAVAAPLRGLWSRGGTNGTGRDANGKEDQASEHQLDDNAAGRQDQQQQQQQQEQEQQPQPSVAQRLSGLRQRLADHLHPPWHTAGQEHKQHPAAAATLLSDPLLQLLDATALLLHSGSSASVSEQLELAAEALRWNTGRQQQQAAAGEGSAPAAQQQDGSRADQLSVDEEEAEDEDIAELSSLSLGARVRRQVARASSAARRRALLLRHQ